MKNKKYTVVIIDDEAICIERLCKSISEFPELTLVGTAQTPAKGMELILHQRPDLLFLDVEMSGQTGLELLSELRERITWPMQVIFHTAYEKYLLDALRASALDYLLKPYDESEFTLIMNRFFRETTKIQSQNSFHEALAKLLPINESFLVATSTGYQKLNLKQIGHFQYQKDKKQWEALLTNQTILQIKRNSSAEDILNYSTSFIQINQHQIINIDFLSTIDDKYCRLLPPFHTVKTLEISRKFMKVLQDKFDLI